MVVSLPIITGAFCSSMVTGLSAVLLPDLLLLHPARITNKRIKTGNA
jgi:hypothetical protein